MVIENENFSPRDGILGASVGNFAHSCLSEECAYTFSIFMKLGESIFSALVESSRVFFLWKLLIQIIGDMGIASDLFW